jgi:hypothetical protein
VCSHYPYESPDPHAPCLKKESKEVSDHLVRELNELAAPAGIEIHEVRLNDLTYAPEIAQSMLMRQQALAMVDARRTIVEGATATVTDAAKRMRDEGIELSVGHSEAFVANLMLVLCSGERVTTVMPIDLDPSSSGASMELAAPRPATLSGGAR